LFVAVAYDRASHRDITLETSDDICGLLLLVETDEGIEHKDADDYSEIHPIPETDCEKGCDLHNCNAMISN
jgi:hypothetical protein